MLTVSPTNGVNDPAPTRPRPVNQSANGMNFPTTNHKANLRSTSSGPDTRAALEASAADLQRLQNRSKAEQLRVKVIMQRDKTVKKAALQPANAGDAHTGAAVPQKPATESESETQLSPEDLFSQEALMATGRAAAHAKMKEHEQKLQVSAASTAGPSAVIPSTLSDVQKEQLTAAAPEQPIQERADDQAEQLKPAESQPPTNLSDAYYADLKLWLEITGYHNTEYRNSKLSTHRERYELEQQAARIANRLQNLQKDEIIDIIPSTSSTVATPAANAVARPPHAPRFPDLFAPPPVNGVKRLHSPEAEQPFKVRRADYHTHDPHAPNTLGEPRRGRRLRDPSPTGGPPQRHVTFPSPRRRSPIRAIVNEPYRRNRDASLGRRQQVDGTGMNVRRQHDLYDPPRRGPSAGYEGHGRFRYSSVNDQAWYEDGRFRDDRRGPRPDLMRGGRRRPR